jgi:hypothetical protein
MAISLLTLQTRVFDLMDEGLSTYITASQCNDQINNAYAQLWSMYIMKDPKYVETDYQFTPVINTRDYALPTNFRRLIRAFALPIPGATAAQSTHVPLRRTMSGQYMGVPSQYSYYYPTGSWIPSYEIYGTNIRLDPTPTVTPTYQIAVWYQADHIPLVVNTDTLDNTIYPGHEQYIVLQAAIMLRMGKEEQPADDLVAERNRIQALIESDLAVQDMGTGKRIIDTDSYDGWVR